MKDFQSTSQPLFGNIGARLMNKDFWGFVPQSYIGNETVSESNCLIFIGGYLAGVTIMYLPTRSFFQCSAYLFQHLLVRYYNKEYLIHHTSQLNRIC